MVTSGPFLTFDQHFKFLQVLQEKLLFARSNEHILLIQTSILLSFSFVMFWDFPLGHVFPFMLHYNTLRHGIG